MYAHNRTERHRRQVQVRVGAVRRARELPRASGLCVVGVAPGGATPLAEVYPEALMRRASFNGERGQEDEAVEWLRFSAVHDLVGLPGLDHGAPSRLRDAVHLALSAGAPTVDVLLARRTGFGPAHVGRAEVLRLLDPFLAEARGALLVYPDLGAEPALRPGESPPRRPSIRALQALVMGVRQHARRWAERYQIGLVDLPQCDAGSREEVGRRLMGTDLVLSEWIGAQGALRRHGWRCGSALVAAILATARLPGLARLDERECSLPPGRRVAAGRGELLSLSPPPAAPSALDDHLVELSLHRRRDALRVLSDRSLRVPHGEWTATALHAVKAIHLRVVRIAERFVFRSADQVHALALQAAVEQGLEPYVVAGLLEGPKGGDRPEVIGGADRNPAGPSLFVVLRARLVPWARAVKVKVSLTSGNQTLLEVA